MSMIVPVHMYVQMVEHDEYDWYGTVPALFVYDVEILRGDALKESK